MPPPHSLVRLLPAAVCVLLLAPSPAQAETREAITSFQVEAEVAQDGALAVSEAITYDFADESSPGLLREIPTTVPDGWLVRHRALEVTDVHVHSPSGAPDVIEHREEGRGWLTLEIGDSDEPVTGEQTYVVDYTVDGLITSEDGFEELYWDAIGTGWAVPIRDAEVRLGAPEITGVECFSGEEGSESACQTLEQDETEIRMAEERLATEHGMTTRVELAPGSVEVAEPDHTLMPLPRWLTWTGVGAVLGALVVVLLSLAAGGKIIDVRRRRDARRFPTELPPRLGAAAAGFLHAKEKLGTEHLLAMLLSLEERGYIVSEPHPRRSDDWLFRLPDGHTPGVSRAEYALLSAMFASGPTCDLEILAGVLTARDAKEIRRGLLQEAQTAGLVMPPWVRVPGMVVSLAVLMCPLMVPFFLGEAVGWQPEPMVTAAIIIVSLPFAFAIMIWLPFHTTRYGEHVKRRLTDIRSAPRGLSPAWAIALGLGNEALDGVEDLIPYDYFRDDTFRRRWDSSLKSSVQQANSSGGSGGGGGGGSVGGGGGGGGGGSR